LIKAFANYYLKSQNFIASALKRAGAITEKNSD